MSGRSAPGPRSLEAVEDEVQSERELALVVGAAMLRGCRPEGRPAVRRADGPSQLEVVHRLRGGSGTDFGVPCRWPEEDDRPIGRAERERLAPNWTT